MSRWDTADYRRIVHATSTEPYRIVDVWFADRDHKWIPVNILLPERADVRWDLLTVDEVDGSHISVPVCPGSGDGGGATIDIPWDTIRTLTDTEFAVHMAKQAEESARRIGRRLQRMRKARGLTAAQLGERVGISQPNISRLENGKHDMSVATLEKVLAAMGYTLSALASFPDDDEPEARARQSASA